MSDITKNKRKWSRILFWLSIGLNVIPMLVFVIKGFVEADSTNKLVLGACGILALIIGGFGLFMKMPIKKTIFWILAIALYKSLGNYSYLIITMALCQIIDEIIVTPLHNNFKTSYKTNKEIDKRMEK